MTRESVFDNYGGYYSVMFSGVEFARFAPSVVWSDYANQFKDDPTFSYEFVVTN